MANMHLVTGYAGEEHIEANDDRSFNVAHYGKDEYVMDREEKFAASILSNNKVRVLSGDIMMQGAHIRKKENTYNEMTIENGAQGYLRNDLIGVIYEKDNITGVETSNMVVIKGEFYEGTQGDPEHDPEFVHGDIVDSGTSYNFMPLYRVEIENITLKKLVPLFKIEGNLPAKIAAIEQRLGGFTLYNEMLTQAQYDALDDEIKTEPKLLFVVKKG